MRKVFIMLFLLLFLSPYPARAGAEDPVKTGEKILNVDVALFPPLVMKNSKGEFYGFDIDLWNAIAKENDYRFVYNEVKFSEIFKRLEKGASDVALAGITLTHERAKKVWFSHHYLDSGLRIMVRADKNEDYEVDLPQILLGIITNRNNLRMVLYYFLLMFVFGSIIYWIENPKDGLPVTEKIGRIMDVAYHITISGTTAYYTSSSKWLAKIFRFASLIMGMIILSGLLVGQITSGMTVQKLRTNIMTKEQLRGKKVATKKCTTSVDTLKRLGAEVAEFDGMEEAYQSLLKKEVDAVVFDAPDLMFFAKNSGDGKVSIVGELFDRQYYSIAFPRGSKLRDEVNLTLLEFRENGVGGKIYRRWLADLEK